MTGSYGQPQLVSIKLVDDGILPANQTAVTEPIDVHRYQRLTVVVSTTTNCTVKVKVGADSNYMAFLKAGTGVQTEDEDRQWNCNNETIAFSVGEYAHYFQLVVTEGGGSDCTLNAWVMGD